MNLDANTISTLVQIAVALATGFGLIKGGNKINNRRKANNAKQQSRDDTLDNLNERITGLKQDLDEVRLQRDDANREIGRVQQQAKDDLADLQQQIELLKKDIDSLKLLNVEAKAKAESIAKERDEQLRETAKIAKELADERKSTADLSRQIDGLKNEIADLKAQLALNRTLEQMVSSITDKLITGIMETVKARQDTEALPKAS